MGIIMELTLLGRWYGIHVILTSSQLVTLLSYTSTTWNTNTTSNHSGKSCLPDTLPRRSFHDHDFDRGRSNILLSLTPAYSARLDFLPLAQLMSPYLSFRPRMTRSSSSPPTHTHTQIHSHRSYLPYLTPLHTAPLLFHEARRVYVPLSKSSKRSSSKVFFQQPLLRLVLKPGDCLSARFPPPPPLPMRRRRG